MPDASETDNSGTDTSAIDTSVIKVLKLALRQHISHWPVKFVCFFQFFSRPHDHDDCQIMQRYVLFSDFQGVICIPPTSYNAYSHTKFLLNFDRFS